MYIYVCVTYIHAHVYARSNNNICIFTCTCIGYGNALNWNVSCPLITDIINNLNSAAKVDEQKGYEDMEEPTKVVLR